MNLFCRFFAGCQHFVDNKWLRHFVCSRFPTAGRSTVKDHNRSTNTMSLVNMADVRSPTLPMKLPVTLKDLGLNAVEILNSDVANPQHLHPDDLHATSVDNNTPRWWIVMTIEEYNSIKPTETAGESTNMVIPALLGSQRMPNFDKLIIAPSPQLALTTMYMHATEMHVTTKIPTKWLMITWVEDVQQHRLRTGNQVINMFNRDYMYPQQQIESGCNLRFTTLELAPQQIWEINAEGGNTMLQQICNYFQWNKDWMWTYNIPVQVCWSLCNKRFKRESRECAKLDECLINICGMGNRCKTTSHQPCTEINTESNNSHVMWFHFNSVSISMCWKNPQQIEGPC